MRTPERREIEGLGVGEMSRFDHADRAGCRRIVNACHAVTRAEGRRFITHVTDPFSGAVYVKRIG